MPYQANATGSTPGIQGDTTINTANGVKATSTAGASAMYATISGVGAGVHGAASGGSGYNSWGVYGSNSNVYGYGVFGIATASQSRGVYGEGDISGVYGYGFEGVTALCRDYNGYGLYVDSYNSSDAALMYGNVYVGGSFTASSKSFLIDHPLDPANRYLEHACVESSEMKTLYDGVGVADDFGVLEVQLPDYFETLNRDARYMLTAIGAPAPDLHVREEVKGGKFVIAGAAPRQKISWSVTGVRNDPFAKAHPIHVDREKSDAEKGRYLNPLEHGQPPERGVHYELRKRARDVVLNRMAPNPTP